MSGEKTEEATDHKLSEARKKGEVGQSQDVHKLLICWGLIEAILALADDGMRQLQSLIELPLRRLDQPFVRTFEEVLVQAGWMLASFSIVAVGLAVLLRVIGGWSQFGPLFAPKAFKLDFNRLNPVNQFKQMFSAQKLTELLTSVLKAAAICSVLYIVVKPALGVLIKLALTDLDQYWHTLADLFAQVAHATLGTLLAIAAFDFGLQKYFFLKRQRMSKEDIRNEHKQAEGDPHTKGHRKSMARQLIDQPPSKPKPSRTEKADMLLVNPTHFAVALYYRPDSTPLPRILYKGHDADARELIAQAQEDGIPVIRYIWLARTLYKSDEGSYIPRDTLQAVAQVYRLLRELDEQFGDEIGEEIIDMPDELKSLPSIFPPNTRSYSPKIAPEDDG
ncbi:MAG TPA: type III secretion system export apparatus subunit SctU [Pseudomonas sp.]|uniref:type III secretion system export apparatus subunit SctU n=1 Tax=Pseudomonas sp. TaxID=306 RepID=UPI002BBC5C10|nr:type III secretion system export apparatus subunit SctU [Pseudomonas sp.]HSX90556.1 type III secretion system export apparatus subunit SctU [Pseudomonas sp.]